MFWSICNHVLRPALTQLDPQRLGMGIWICQCVKSEEWNAIPSVWCLRERIQFGTAPWKNDLAPALLLGSESLAGYSVSKGQPAVCQNVRENTAFLPVRQEEFEESAAAFPLVQGEKIAGSLLLTSTQPDYFTHVRLNLIQRYVQLVSLAFHDHEFCDRGEIHLRDLPPTSVQQEHFASFRQRVTDTMNLGGRKGPKDISEAEALVWSQFAAELADVAS
jgi:GAF domain-containing protein